MIRAISKLEPDWYTPDSEQDEAVKTQFLLGPLTQIDNLRIGGLVKVINNGEDIVVEADAVEIALTGGLFGWRNFKDTSGVDVVFTQFQKSNIDKVPRQYLLELAAVIVARSNTSEEEEKKS